MKESKIIAPDYTVTDEYYNTLKKQGICVTCLMKHEPSCDGNVLLCRTCGCGKEWHPLDGRCRVGPETEFTLFDCHCLGYVPKENLAYFKYLYEKQG